MKPLALTLKGFRGIRDGLGREILTLDLESLARDAQLIAIIGTNGRGKTSLLENLSPFLALPSRASACGPGGFAFYDHVYLPESEKDLVWSHAGQRYRSQIVIRLNGKRRTEAFLFREGERGWEPVRLEDGTVSDGKVETYERCVEAILGNAETFYTSVFSAQGKRQLSTYRNAEIKGLLADLLGLEEIRKVGQQAAETAKLVRAGLVALRHEGASLDERIALATIERDRLSGARGRIDLAVKARLGAQQALDAARTAEAHLCAEQKMAQQTEVRRAALIHERQTLTQSAKDTQQQLDAQAARERQRLAQLQQRVASRATEAGKRRSALESQRSRLQAALAHAGKVAHANRRLALAARVSNLHGERVAALRCEVGRLRELQSEEKAARQALATLERDAGQASLRAAELAQRFKLTEAVPCFGTDLQGRCQLLGDTREAKALIPSAELRIDQLARQQKTKKEELAALCAKIDQIADSPTRLLAAEHRFTLAQARASRLGLLAARAAEIEQAQQSLEGLEQEWLVLAQNAQMGETPDEARERAQIDEALQTIDAQRQKQGDQTQETRQLIEASLAALPTPYDNTRLLAAKRAVEQAAAVLAETERAYLAAIGEVQALELAERQTEELAAQRSALAQHVAAVEKALGTWTFFAKCLGNDGVIALAIDEAGPTLASMTNDLLMACYGPRFTLSIKTLVETGKGETREGFDIVVHDAESGETKNAGLMSGGERVWINEALVRAVAIFLAQNTGRHYATLFSDEADGPLDPERKRMFLAMKREVLRLGGYEQEYFVSQTPELTAMADAVIDLDAMVADSFETSNPDADERACRLQ